MALALRDLICNCLLITQQQIFQTISKLLLELLTSSLDCSSLGLKHCPGGEHQPPYWSLSTNLAPLPPPRLPQCTTPGGTIHIN